MRLIVVREKYYTNNLDVLYDILNSAIFTGAAEQYNFRWGSSSQRAYKGGKFQKNYFSQPLKSGEADASPASPVPRPLLWITGSFCPSKSAQILGTRVLVRYDFWNSWEPQNTNPNILRNAHL